MKAKKANLDEFIRRLQNELPELVTPEMLLEFGLANNHTQLFRIRQNSELPFIKTSSARILYLKADVIDWIRKKYYSDVSGKKERV